MSDPEITPNGWQSAIRVTGEATAELPLRDGDSPIVIIGTDAIRRTFDNQCLQQAVNSRLAPGVSKVVINPDAHLGYGAPVGCVMTSPTHVFPGPVGVDIKCSMSLLQTDVPADAIQDREVRRKLIRAICQRTPTGAGKGQRNAPKSRSVDERLGMELCAHGASRRVLKSLDIPGDWAERCEDAYHRAPDGSIETLETRLDYLLNRDILPKFREKVSQLGSYGGGNHFGECEVVQLSDDPARRAVAESFGLRDGCVAFLSHCGSRGMGHNLAMHQFRSMQGQFRKAGLSFPGGDRELVYAEAGSDEGIAYLCDMAIGANFATINHLLINSLVLEAFQHVLPGTRGQLVYFISHNIVRQEPLDGRWEWVHRKGATRAFPAGHPELQRTPYFETGHPILLPGNPRDGSAVMVATPGAAKSCYSINHGAGRAMGRKAAQRQLNQAVVDEDLENHDILSNCREYPIDEAPAAYKNFNEVLRSVELADLAVEVARLRARFVIKDGSLPDD